MYFVAKRNLRNGILLFFSLLFYAWGEPVNIFVMVISIVINYVFGILVSKEWRFKRFFVIFSIVYNLGILFIFKYLNFSVDTLNSIFGLDIQIGKIMLPIGISFYTFQIMSYVIDVYRNRVAVQRNILDLGLYIALFPQLIAGPIVRYIDIQPKIKNRISTFDNIYNGLVRFCQGFIKKILIADRLSLLVDTVFTNQYPSIWGNWVGILAYTLQIYYDFSAYSDMAIGLGEVFGFHFLENFNFPYCADSIKEFWRRWHISLSSWFKDYLYIPLGGNRKGKVRTYINLAIVFLLTGLWHGASLNFIVWGAYHGIFLIIERMGFDNVLKKLPKAIRHIYTILLVMIGWVFFRADGINKAIAYISGMFSSCGNDLVNVAMIMNAEYWFCLIVGILFAIPHTRLTEKVRTKHSYILVMDGLTIVLFIVAVSYMIGSGYSPFLYFRF